MPKQCGCGCHGSQKWGIVFFLVLAALLASSLLFDGDEKGRSFAETSEKNEAAAFSYDDYAAVLKHVDEKGLVDYRKLKEEPQPLRNFQKALSQLSHKSYESWSKDEKLAFWINVYNGLTLAAIVDHYPIKSSLLKSLAFPKNSIRQIDGVWEKLTFNVMGRKVTLNHIEHEILRKEFKRPEIHMSLVCAALSCPTFRNEPFRAEILESQFENQARQFVSHSLKFKIDRAKKMVYLSKIFEWFGQDFIERFLPESGFTDHDPKQRASLHYVSLHVSDADADYLQNQTFRVKYLDYDWTLNEQPPKPKDDS